MEEASNSKSQPKLTINEMWSLVNRQDSNWGIEGYEIHKKHVDPKRQEWERQVYEKNLKVWAKKDHYDKPKTVDADGKPIVIKRPNFLDEVMKWARSYYSEERAKTILEAKGDKMNEAEKKPIIDKKKFNSERKLYTDWIEYYEKKKNQERVFSDNFDKDGFMEKMNWPRKTHLDKIKETYGKDKGSLPYFQFYYRKADRVTVCSEAEYVGERLPFYNTAPDKNGGEEEGKGNAKKLFFPNKNPTWHKDPVWSVKEAKKTQEEQEILERKKAQDQERIENIVKTLEEKKIDIKGDVMKTFNGMKSYKKLNFTYNKPTPKSEQYATWRTTNPPKYPGPQQYFKTPVEDLKKKKKKGGEDAEAAEPQVAEGEEKIYYSNRKIIDKKIYKPMKSHIF